jgi:hypothetical protein
MPLAPSLVPAIRASRTAPAGPCNAHSGAFRASVDPGLNDRAELFLTPRRWLAPSAGPPTPRYQIVLGHMLVKQSEVAPAVARRVFNLAAYLAGRFSFPRHFDWSQAPARVSRDALIGRRAYGQRKIAVGVARRAMLPGHPVIGFTTQRQGPMDVTVISLMRLIAGRMAVHAARTGNHLRRFVKQRPRSRGAIGNVGECAGCYQIGPLLRDRFGGEQRQTRQ